MSLFDRFKRSPEEPDEIELMLKPKIARDTFLLLYSKLLSARMTGKELRNVEPFGLEFEGENGWVYTIHLENLWVQVQKNRREGRRFIERHLSAMMEAGSPVIVQPDKILPMLKGQGYIEELGDDAVAKFAIEHLVADLWIGYNQRSDGSYLSLSRKELESAAIEFRTIRALALGNLDRMMPEIEFEEDGPAFVLKGGGELTATTLLTDTTWDWLVTEEVVSKNVVVAVPVDHMVLFADADSVDGVRMVRNRAREYFEELDHSVSPTVLRRVDGGWKALD